MFSYRVSLKKKNANKLASPIKSVKTIKYTCLEKNPKKNVVMNPAQRLDSE